MQGFLFNGGEIGIRTLGTPIGVQLISSQPHSTTLPSLHSRPTFNKVKSINLQAKFYYNAKIFFFYRFDMLN